MARRRSHVRYFADENALGPAKILLQERDDIVAQDVHCYRRCRAGLPIWIGWRLSRDLTLIVITRERRLRTRPAELEAYRSYGVRSSALAASGACDPPSSRIFTRLEPRLTRVAQELGPGPWAVSMHRPVFESSGCAKPATDRQPSTPRLLPPPSRPLHALSNSRITPQSVHSGRRVPRTATAR
jgi:hypothetical protein